MLQPTIALQNFIKESLSKSKMSISPESPTLTNLPLSIKLKNLDKKKLKIVEED